jgi:Uma2 family endonuclease
MGAKTLITAEQFAAMPEAEAARYELYEGELIEVPFANVKHNRIRDEVLVAFKNFLRQSHLGMAVSETEIELRENVVWRPDVLFLTTQQYSRVDEDHGPIKEIPRLVVEVASENQGVEELFRRAEEYLAAGVHTVWLVLKDPPEFHVRQAGARPQVLGLQDTLDAPEILPGFSIPISEIFRKR